MKVIGGCFKGQKIQSPPGRKARPTSSKARETLFNLWQTKIRGARVLDLFSGSGAIGIEALSRGAADVVFVEVSKPCVRCIQQSMHTIAPSLLPHIVRQDVFRYLNSLPKGETTFDLIYADPPYGLKGKNGVLLAYDVANSIDAKHCLSPEGVLCIEERPGLAFNELAFPTLHFVEERKIGSTSLYKLIWKDFAKKPSQPVPI